jgi:serine/threonine protein kinase/tetratricopeptide (TPR) repeat protein
MLGTMSDLLAALRAALGDRFRIDRELSGGGMSRVFVAEEVTLGRTVVLKVLPPDAAVTVNADRFRREVQFAARLQHPHIVPVLSTGEDVGTLWYTMPYVDGDTLRGRLAAGRMDVREALTFWQHMLDALSHAHHMGIVHRDMKPDNVLVSGRNALVTDFGIAKAVVSATTAPMTSALTGVGFVVGTPAYMAPEQAAGVDQVDARADLYSTALVVYEMLTGTAAFGGLTPPQTLAAQVQTMPVAPATLNPAISAEVEALLMQCLAKDPEARPVSADAVLEALDAIQRGVATPSRETPAARRRTRSRAMAVGAAVVAVAVSTVLLLTRHRGPATASEQRDLVLLASFEHEPRDSSVARALSEAFRIDLQQSPRLRVAEPQLVRTTLQSMRLDPGVRITDSIARALGVRLGAKAYITGTLSPLGSGHVLTARLVSVADGREVAAMREAAASNNDLLDATDRLSKTLRERAGESVASLRASPALPAATTSSLEALERYASAVLLMREGKQGSALEEYERAVALDSTFASAWSGIGTSLANMQIRPGDRLRAAQRAFELREKLPEMERLRIESRYYSARGEQDKEIVTLRRILAIEPTSYATLNNLGRLMLGTRQYAPAESLLIAAVRSQPDGFAPMDMLFALAAETGNSRLTDSLARAIPSSGAGERLRWSVISAKQISEARYPVLAQQLDSVLGTNPSPDFSGPLYSQRVPLHILQGQLQEAERLLVRLTPMMQRLDPALTINVGLELAQARAIFLDDRAGAKARIAKADAFYGKRTDAHDRYLLPRALSHAVVGETAMARRLLGELPVILPRDSVFVRYVEAEIALAERRPADAVEMLRPNLGRELFCGVCGHGALARAYDAMGEKDSVLAVYTRLIESRETNGRFYEDAYERARALKRAGELLEERGETTRALTYYRDFVELWKDADPELEPIVRDVRERIARLEGRRS